MKNIGICNKIWSKRKQIVFALFAFICYYLDSKNNTHIIKAAAPAVVAGAAKAAKGAKTAKNAVETANAVKKASDTSKTIKEVNAIKNTTSKSTSALTQRNANVLNRNIPKNTNPSSNLSNNKNFTTSNFSTETSNKDKKGFLKSFTPSESTYEEDDDDESILSDSASKTVLKISPFMMIGCLFFGIIFFTLSLPLLALGIVNPTNSSLSQIDCTKQQGDNCEIEDDTSFFSKLKNLFKTGTYGSNAEVVLKELNDTYDRIKEEYDFEISLSLLTSTIFADSLYIKTEVKDGNISITDDMLERIQYMYDTASLQLIPEYNIYTCSNDYTSSYNYTLIPTYLEGDTTTEDVQDIPTGECNYYTSGGQYKTISYHFDEDLYFERLRSSDELDLLYKNYSESDDLLVSLIRQQYSMYKYLYNVDEELSYDNIPVQLYTDSNVMLSSPLKGWTQITSPFGNREGEYAGMHTGIDLVAGDKNIYAAGSGVVTRSNVETEGGNIVEITHTDSSGREYVSQYAHLSERLVAVGDIVNTGDVIGIMGDTGTMASGVHLHFAMWDKETNNYYNPRKLFTSASNY